MECTAANLTPLIARVWPRLVAFVAAIACMVAGRGGQIDGHTRAKALRLLRPAEAMVRRVIALMAIEMNLETQAPCNNAADKRKPACRQTRSPGGFTLFEPVPTFAACFGTGSGKSRFTAGPRIIDLAAPLIPAPQTPAHQTAPPTQTDMLLARIDALQAAMRAPEKHARRLARRTARTLADPQSKQRITPLRPGWPPGLRGRETPDWLAAVLLDLNSAIRCRPPPRPPERIGTDPGSYDRLRT
ncbi:hypothetical protein [Henriciella marina]|uniref:hypothetical protein n=1 Tax=Henriciella marina TaxID=453851 RepID=UPI00036DAD6D|nr:hypothetical protein [Henriciella marina]